MRINVIIPNFNGGHLLSPCLDSLHAQTRHPDRVIVVDNGSTDGSRKIVEEHPVTPLLVSFPENRGFAAAVNHGIKAYEADVVALLNNDMVCDPRWIEYGEKALELYERADMVASLVLQSRARDLVDSAGDRFPPSARPAHVSHGRRAASLAGHSMEVVSPCAGAAFYRKSMFSETDYFEESFFAYLEDVDLGIRARSQGRHCLFFPQAVTYHLGAATELDDKKAKKPVDSAFRVRWIAENRVRVVARNLPSSFLIGWLPWIAAGLVRSAAYHLFVSGQARAFREGFFQGLAKWRQDRRSFKSAPRPAFRDVEALMKKGAIPWQSL